MTLHLGAYPQQRFSMHGRVRLGLQNAITNNNNMNYKHNNV